MASSVANVKCFPKLHAPCRLSVEWNAFRISKLQILTPDVYILHTDYSIRTHTHLLNLSPIPRTSYISHTHTCHLVSGCHNNIFESFSFLLHWPLCFPQPSPQWVLSRWLSGFVVHLEAPVAHRYVIAIAIAEIYRLWADWTQDSRTLNNTTQQCNKSIVPSAQHNHHHRLPGACRQSEPI